MKVTLHPTPQTLGAPARLSAGGTEALRVDDNSHRVFRVPRPRDNHLELVQALDSVQREGGREGEGEGERRARAHTINQSINIYIYTYPCCV
jgi:hypothetical protein